MKHLALVLLLVAFVTATGYDTGVDAAQSEWITKASWYGDPARKKDRFHQKRTSFGERFNTFELVAAHRTLPEGTKLEITNLKNGRTVVATIADRGPYVRGRGLDLSYAAARCIGMLDAGVATVKVKVL